MVNYLRFQTGEEVKFGFVCSRQKDPRDGSGFTVVFVAQDQHRPNAGYYNVSPEMVVGS